MNGGDWIRPIAIAAAVVLLLIVIWVILPSQTTREPTECCPMGVPLAIGAPSERPQGGSAGELELYDFPIQSAGSGLSWNDLAFQLQSPSGAILATTSTGWNLTVFESSGRSVAAYSIQAPSPTWTSGGSGQVSSNEAIFLVAPVASTLHGDTLIVTMTGPSDASLSVSIL